MSRGHGCFNFAPEACIDFRFELPVKQALAGEVFFHLENGIAGSLTTTGSLTRESPRSAFDEGGTAAAAGVSHGLGGDAIDGNCVVAVDGDARKAEGLRPLANLIGARATVQTRRIGR